MAANNKRPAKDLNNSVTSTPVKPSAKKGKANDDDESDLTKLIELVAQMNKKLDKLRDNKRSQAVLHFRPHHRRISQAAKDDQRCS